MGQIISLQYELNFTDSIYLCIRNSYLYYFIIFTDVSSSCLFYWFKIKCCIWMWLLNVVIVCLELGALSFDGNAHHWLIYKYRVPRSECCDFFTSCNCTDTCSCAGGRTLHSTATGINFLFLLCFRLRNNYNMLPGKYYSLRIATSGQQTVSYMNTISCKHTWETNMYSTI